MSITSLSPHEFINLISYRKTGTAVATPVWFVHDADTLYVMTGHNAGKVKRIRNNSQVMLAPCDARGKLKGDQVPGQASLQDAHQTERTTELVRKRYGLLGWLLTRRGGDDRQGISVSLA